MARDYQKDMYRQLAELMLKHDCVLEDVKNIKTEHKQDIQELKNEHKKEKEALNARIDTLEREISIVKVENVLLKNDNERLKRIIVDLYGEGAMSIGRIQDFINSISEGGVYNALKQFDKKIQPLLKSIKENLLNESVLYTDATNVRVADSAL